MLPVWRAGWEPNTSPALPRLPAWRAGWEPSISPVLPRLLPLPLLWGTGLTQLPASEPQLDFAAGRAGPAISTADGVRRQHSERS